MFLLNYKFLYSFPALKIWMHWTDGHDRETDGVNAMRPTSSGRNA